MGGAYFEYKHFTDKFVDWILSASNLAEKNSIKLPNNISNLTLRVSFITSLVPTNPITPSCCVGLQKALQHGIKAIEKRTIVNKCYTQQFERLQSLPLGASQTDLSGEKHAHFISVLQDCYDKLSTWFDQVKHAFETEDPHGDDASDEEGSVLKLRNRFESLLLDEDSDDESEDESDDGKPMKNERKAERVIEIEEIDQGLGEVRILVICFVLDVLTCFQYVNDIWLTQLKQMESIYGEKSKGKGQKSSGKKAGKDEKDMFGEEKEVSIITVLGVTTVAFRTMDALYAQLCVQIPGLVNAYDFLSGIFQNILSKEVLGPSPFATFFDDALQQCRVLQTFVTQLLVPHISAKLVFFNRNSDKVPVLIEQYYELPNTAACKERFFHAELSTLFNHFNELSSTAYEYFRNYPATATFMDEFLRFFRPPHTITLPLVLRCMCWWNVVQLMQSTELLNMGRWIYFMRTHSRKFLRMLSIKPTEQPLLAEYQRMHKEFGMGEEADLGSANHFPLEDYEYHHHNPILCGLNLLDRVVVENSCTTGLLTLNIQNCLLYLVLRQEGYLKKPIPFFEFYLNSFGRYMFPPVPSSSLDSSSASLYSVPIRGNYETSSLLKFRVKLKTLAILKAGKFPKRNRPAPHMAKSLKSNNNTMEKPPDEDLLGQHCSAMRAIIKNNDLSKVIMSGSIDVLSILKSVTRILQTEVYESRILAIHSLKCNRLFHSLNMRYYHQVVPHLRNPITFDMVHSSSNRVIALSTLAIAAINFVVLPAFDKVPDTSAVDTTVSTMCRNVAEIMSSFFKDISIEKEIFILPMSQRAFVRAEFGAVRPAEMVFDEHFDILNQLSAQIFRSHTEQLPTVITDYIRGDGYAPTRKTHIETFKEAGREVFLTLQICDDTQSLNTVLDHSTCGALQDMEMAEWVIQMKGLYTRCQIMYDGTLTKRLRLGGGEKGKSLSHLQHAVKAKNEWAVKLILSATQGRDLDYKEEKEGNTALHLAVLAGNLSNYLSVMIYNGHLMATVNHKKQQVFEMKPGSEELRNFLENKNHTFMKVDTNEFRMNAQREKLDQEREALRVMQEEANKSVMKVKSALNGMEKKRTGKKGKGKNEEIIVTPEEEKRAADAARELLAELEEEEAKAKIDKNSKKKGGQKKK